MRWIFAGLAVAMLTGCPGVTRLYVHNQSDYALVYTGPWKPDRPIVIKPERTAWVPVRSGEVSCIAFTANGRLRGYIIDFDVQMSGTGTRYGSRIDAIYKDGDLVVRRPTGYPLILETRDSCQTQT